MSTESKPKGSRRTTLAVVVVVPVVVVALVAAWLAMSDDDGGIVAPSSTSAPSTSTSRRPAVSTTAPVVTQGDDAAIWPFPGQPAFASPVEAARSFAVEYLGFTDPIVGELERSTGEAGHVPIRPQARGPVTTISVHREPGNTGWSVLGATTENIELTEPSGALANVVSPVHLRGQALTFEGHVNVEIRADGGVEPIGHGFVTGGGDVQRPFEGVVAFETPGSARGAIVLFTESAEDGRRWQAVAARLSFDSPDGDAQPCGTYRAPRPRPRADQMEVKAYFTCDAGGGDRPFPVYRLTDRTPRVLESSLRVLVAGPTEAERRVSVSSWFSADTSATLRSVTIGEGHAVVDLDDLRALIPNASSSAGSTRLLAELDATVFQFPSVRSVEYRIDGSCEDFNEWLQYGGCERRTRGESPD